MNYINSVQRDTQQSREMIMSASVTNVLGMFNQSSLCVITNEDGESKTHTVTVVEKEHGTFDVEFDGIMIVDEENIHRVTIMSGNTLLLEVANDCRDDDIYIITLYKKISSRK